MAHSCGATDKSFIKTATVDVTALNLWASGYQSGEIDADDLVAQAYEAAKRVSYQTPHDPSLQKAQRLLDAMFREYGDAVKLKEKGENAGQRMYRAYGLANFARQVLVDAEPALSKRGCHIEALL